MAEVSHCFGTCPGIVVKTFGSIYDHGNDLQACRMSVLNFYNFDFGSASESAPPGAPSAVRTEKNWQNAVRKFNGKEIEWNSNFVMQSLCFK